MTRAWRISTIRRSVSRSPRRAPDSEHQHEIYIRNINAALADRPEGLAVTTRICRGNFQSSWAASGRYDFVAEALFSSLDVDGFFLEDKDQAQTPHRRSGQGRTS